ncbi:MAG TPA: hypothetical protein DEP66_07275 [Acidimicrobiaceae bacterium]|nr:hypothetical protein [Acidimicrobiaceae bacterium]
MTARFAPRPDGTVAVLIQGPERAFLASLASQLRDHLLGASVEGDAEVEQPLRRLFPVAYADDAERDADYQRLTRDDLMTARLEQMQALERCATADRLDADDVTMCLRALNALRLVMGTALDVSEGDDDEMLDADDEHDRPRIQFLYLGHLLGELVDAATASANPEGRDYLDGGGPEGRDDGPSLSHDAPIV